MDHFTSTDLAEIVDDLRRWVAAAGASGPVSPARTVEQGPEAGRGADGAGR